MIDTVAITIEPNNFKILDHKRFTPSSKGLFDPPYLEFGRNSYLKCVYNPTKMHLEHYKYLPRLTLMKAIRRGGFAITLKVEFSTPKLLYGNNFDELEESDFGEVCWKLKEMLSYMGVQIDDIKAIANAEVSSIHYSKNIILTDFSTPYTILKEVAKVNVNRLLDMNQTDFRNEGHAIKYHSNDYEVIFYDKLKDLKQAKLSEKRTVERDNYVQVSLFDQLEMKTPFEVLRMEVRLGSRKKIRDILKKANLESEELTFMKLFSQNISMQILLNTLSKIENEYPLVLTSTARTNEELLIQLVIDNPKMKFKKLMAIIGVKTLLAEIGTRKFRDVIDKYEKNNWYRINKEMKTLIIRDPSNPFLLIKNELISFKKIVLDDYKDRM